MGFYFQHYYVGTLVGGSKSVTRFLDEVQGMVDRHNSEDLGTVSLEVVRYPHAIDATLRVRDEGSFRYPHVTLFLREIRLGATHGEWHIVGYQSNDLEPSLYLVLYEAFDYLLQQFPIWIVIDHETIDEEATWVFCSRGYGDFEVTSVPDRSKLLAPYRAFLDLKKRVSERYHEELKVRWSKGSQTSTTHQQ